MIKAVKNMDKLSVILPAYNEEHCIEANVSRLDQKFKSLTVDYEIIIVNDGSTDNTLAKAKGCASGNIRVLSYFPNRGKGYAVHYGMLNSSGACKLFMDADLSTSLDILEKAVELVCSGQCDVLIGDRKSKSSQLKIKQPLYRIFFGRGFTFISSLLIGRRINDFTCGFKIYSKTAADIIFTRQRIFGWAFDAELIYIASLHNLRIYEIPVTWSHHGNSKVRLLRDIARSLRSLITMRINALKGLYK